MRNIFLAVLSGLLFAFSWPTNGLPILIFIAFIPLLLAEKDIRLTAKNTKSKVFGLGFLSFLIWNLYTTGWLYYADLTGMIFAITFNTSMMSLVFLGYHLSAKRLAEKWSLVFLASLWMSFEYLHLQWDFSWPWLSLGNVFSEYVSWIQWYEFTGTFGGALWIWCSNIFVYKVISATDSTRDMFKKAFPKLILLIALPIVVSLWMFHRYEIKGEQKEVILLQPNIDPYTEKYDNTNSSMTQLLLEQTDAIITKNTEYVIAPETVLAENLPFDRFLYSDVPLTLRNYIQKHPKVQFLWGIDTYDLFTDESQATIYSNRLREDLWGNFYNMAFFINADYTIQKYYKSKLVPGIETFPIKPILEPLIGDIMLNLGGTISIKTIQPERSVFVANDQTLIAPIICYESVYGAYVTGYVKNGAEFLAIITNDAWWSDTQAHKQHLSLARLRAIETRRDIARSANTGISAFINQKGEIVSRTKYDEKTALIGKVTLNQEKTIYVILGDFIAKIAIGVMTILLLIMVFRKSKTPL